MAEKNETIENVVHAVVRDTSTRTQLVSKQTALWSIRMHVRRSLRVHDLRYCQLYLQGPGTETEPLLTGSQTESCLPESRAEVCLTGNQAESYLTWTQTDFGLAGSQPLSDSESSRGMSDRDSNRALFDVEPVLSDMESNRALSDRYSNRILSDKTFATCRPCDWPIEGHKHFLRDEIFSRL